MSVFGTAGVRGLFGRDVDPRFSMILSYLFSKMSEALWSSKTVSLGWDCRVTSYVLAEASASGAVERTDVIILGMVPYPVLAKYCERGGCPGIYITASHNPPEYNGMKFFRPDGMELTSEEQDHLEEMLNKFSDMQDGSAHDLRYDEFTRPYLEMLREEMIEMDRLKVVCDPANGAASYIGPLALCQLGCEVLSINSHVDGFFPGRSPEPTEDNLTSLSKTVVRMRADLGMAWDGDGDRFAVMDERGTFIPQYKVSAAIALLLKARLVITSVDMSNALDDVVDGEVVRWRLGDLHTVYLKLGRQADLVTEPWKIMDPRWGPFFDGIRGSLLFLKAIDEWGSLRDLMSSIPDYKQLRMSFYCDKDKQDRLHDRIVDILREELGKPDDESFLDGVKLFYGSSWVLVRKSGTEPKIRIYAESKSDEWIYRVRKMAYRFADLATHRFW